MPGLRLRGLLSHAGHAYHAASEGALRRSRPRKRRRCAICARAPRRRGSRSTRSRVGATPTLRFSAGQPGVTELRPGNYVVLRPHAGRARRGVARRLRADGAGDASSPSRPRSHHPRLRQQDADERSGARHSPTRRATARCWPAIDARLRAGIDETLLDRAAVRGARDRPRHRRPRRSSRATASASSRTTPASSRTWWIVVRLVDGDRVIDTPAGGGPG